MSKICEMYATTQEDLLNIGHVTPCTGYVDVYIIVTDYIDMRIDKYAVWDGHTWKLLNDMKSVVNYASKHKDKL